MLLYISLLKVPSDLIAHMFAVQLLEGSVASLPEGDSKTIWRTYESTKSLQQLFGCPMGACVTVF